MKAEAFQALSDPTRRQILDVLRAGPKPVNELVDAVAIQQSGVSRHLRILHEAGFVDVKADGQRRLYALRPQRFRELDAWLQGFRSLWEGRMDRFGEALKTRRAAATQAANRGDKRNG